MTRKIVTSYETDTQTGEITPLTGYSFVAQPRKKNGFKEFFAMGQPAAIHLAKNITSGETLRVFLAICADVQMENHVIVNQSDIARRLNMKQQNVGRAMKELLTKKYCSLVRNSADSQAINSILQSSGEAPQTTIKKFSAMNDCRPPACESSTEDNRSNHAQTTKPSTG